MSLHPKATTIGPRSILAALQSNSQFSGVWELRSGISAFSDALWRFWYTPDCRPEHGRQRSTCKRAEWSHTEVLALSCSYYVDLPPQQADSPHAVKGPSGKKELELLQGISGAFRPKKLTALMGVTGAGKTTLMDVLAGRKTGWQTAMLALSTALSKRALLGVSIFASLPSFSALSEAEVGRVRYPVIRKETTKVSLMKYVGFTDCRMCLEDFVSVGGRITGDIRLNGFPKEQDSFARVSGYVEQVSIAFDLQLR